MTHVKTIAPHLFAAVPRFYEKLAQGIDQEIEKMPAALRNLVQWARCTGEAFYRTNISGVNPLRLLRLKFWIADRFALRHIRRTMGTNLRYFISGSAAMPAHLIDHFGALGWPILEAYGISENIVPMAMNVPGTVRPGSVGKPLPPNQVRVAEDGEILVKSKGVAVQIDGLAADGFLKTGDIGHLDPDGYLWLTGRKSDIFKLSTGHKVIGQAIEAAITRLMPVEYCVAVGADRKFVTALINVPSAAWEPLIAIHGGAAGATAYLREQCQKACRQLPRHCIPVDILMVHDAFSPQTGELTTNLKLRRQAVLTKHAAAIDALYQSLEHQPKVPEAVLPMATPQSNGALYPAPQSNCTG